MSLYRPTEKPWISEILRQLNLEIPSLQLSIVGGILRNRFKDRYGYEPYAYSEFVGNVEVVLCMCFDCDFDIVTEALKLSEAGIAGMHQPCSTRTAAAA